MAHDPNTSKIFPKFAKKSGEKGANPLKLSFKSGVHRIKFLNKALGDRQIKLRRSQGRIHRVFQFNEDAAQKGASWTDLFTKEEEVIEDFNEIVDQDMAQIEDYVSRQLVGDMLDSMSFRLIILGLIIVNSVLIGLQTDEYLSVEYSFQFSIFDNCVLTIFVCEIILKWYNGFFVFWKNGWNVLDFVVVSALFLGPTLTFLGSSRILRILRVVRAFRSLRSVSAFAGLTMVIQAILQSLPDMTNIVVLMVIILLVFSVSGVTLFGEIMPRYFGDLGSAMFTNFICVTQDGWATIFGEFKALGTDLYVGGALYFFASIMLGAFVFANLVVAVMVTNLDSAMHELSEEKRASEDTLASYAGGNADPNSSDFHEHEVPVLRLQRDILPRAKFHKQKPLQLPDLSHVTAEKTQNYFVVLRALEQNLCDYTQLREDLEDIFNEVLDLNESIMEEVIQTSEDTAVVNKDYENFLEKTLAKRGDVISNLIELEKHQIINSNDKFTLNGIIQHSGRLVPGLGSPMSRKPSLRHPSRIVVVDDSKLNLAEKNPR